ncbi:hypothetical protein [Psychrobacillus sp. FSL K6-1464]|uniref:hypothetical protein n=1 Tax=Psychrobacillus sp. FSL K6-1464 TaxID=2921545 RepID=UPI0030F6BD9E
MNRNQIELFGKVYYSCTQSKEMDSEAVRNFHEHLERALIGSDKQVIGMLISNIRGEISRYAISMRPDATFQVLSNFFRNNFEWWVSELGELAAVGEYNGVTTFVLVKKVDFNTWDKAVKFLSNNEKILHISERGKSITIENQDTTFSQHLFLRWEKSIGCFW